MNEAPENNRQISCSELKSKFLNKLAVEFYIKIGEHRPGVPMFNGPWSVKTAGQCVILNNAFGVYLSRNAELAAYITNIDSVAGAYRLRGDPSVSLIPHTWLQVGLKCGKKLIVDITEAQFSVNNFSCVVPITAYPIGESYAPQNYVYRDAEIMPVELRVSQVHQAASLYSILQRDETARKLICSQLLSKELRALPSMLHYSKRLRDVFEQCGLE